MTKLLFWITVVLLPVIPTVGYATSCLTQANSVANSIGAIALAALAWWFYLGFVVGKRIYAKLEK